MRVRGKRHTTMALRDILVMLDSSVQSATRLQIAVSLAQRDAAYLIGFCALNMMQPGGHPGVEISIAEETERIKTEFRNRLRFAGLQGEWRETTDNVSEALAHRMRHVDLTILGQVDQNHPPPAGRHLIEDVLLTGGRPILVIPHVGRFETLGTNVLVGWNNSREATRALNDAIPLIANNASVLVLEAYTIGSKSASDDTTSGEAASHLTRHGFNAKTALTALTGVSASDVLLSYAADVSADLLVVGGYGHSRLRELVLGGVTRELLQHMTLPVLMSH